MITSIERIGSEKNHDGWFLINKHLNVQYITEIKDGKEGVTINMNFDDKVMTEDEAYELAEHVLKESIELRKSLHAK